MRGIARQDGFGLRRRPHTVLITTARVKGQGDAFELAGVQFTCEPYGLTMRRDADFRLAVDRTLARLYRSGEIGPLLERWFAPIGRRRRRGFGRSAGCQRSP